MLTEYKLGNTRYGYDPITGQAIAFGSPEERAKYFTNPMGEVEDLPIDPTSLNASANNIVNLPVDQSSLAKSAGKAGLGIDDWQKLASTGITADETATIRKNLGIDALESKVFTTAPSTQKLYTDAYSMAGLADIKSQYEAKVKELNAKKEELNQRLATINENPWKVEATRVGAIAREKEFYDGTLSNLAEEAKFYSDLYNQGLSEVNNLVSRQSTDFTNEQASNQAKLNYLLQQVESQSKALLTEKNAKVARYLPEYLKSKQSKEVPKTINTDNGTFVWNETTRTFEPLAGSNKPITSGSSGSSGDFMTNSQIVSTINQIAGAFDNEPIVKEFNTISSQLEFVKTAGKTPTDDIGRIYAFAKVMDPNSVVREGEYKTVQEYAQALLKTYGFNVKRVFTNSGFLTDEARSFLLSTLTRRFQATQTQYSTLQQRYQQQIDSVKSGNVRGIIDYTVPTTSSMEPSQSTPKQTQVTTQNIQALIRKAKQAGDSKEEIIKDLIESGAQPEVAQRLVNINYY